MPDPFVVVGLDTETGPILPGLLTPPLVCVSLCFNAADGGSLHLREDGTTLFEDLLEESNAHFAIHNSVFDLAVFVVERPSLLPKVFAALDAGRIHCTALRDKMLWNAKHGLTDDNGPKVSFALDAVVLRRFDVDISESKHGADSWRLRYIELDGVPLDQWPPEAVQYAKDDAVWHLRVYEDQERERAAATFVDTDGLVTDPLHDEPGQVRADFALHLMGIYGVRTDEVAVQKLEADLTVIVEAAEEKLRASGILKGKSVRKRDTGLSVVTWSENTKLIKSLVEAALGANTPKTDPSDTFPEGQTKIDEETLRSTGNPDLLVLADVGTDRDNLKKWGPALRGMVKNKQKKFEQRGMRIPTGVTGWLINANWNVLVSTGRTSCWAPAWQQPPRKGDVRPCVIPRPGNWFISVDYSFIELVCWAQTCLDLFGVSDMADVIRAGKDPHVNMAVEILRSETDEHILFYTDKRGLDHSCSNHEMTYEFLDAARRAGAKWAKDARQLAKAANFGLPGGLGAATFILFAKGNYDVIITEEAAWKLKTTWKRKWREADMFFNHVSQIQQQAFGQPFQIVLPRTGFVRGGCTFTSGCNTYFQGLAARGAKEALWNVAKACYLHEVIGGALHPMYGCRPVLFLHDEIITEVPADRDAAFEAALALQNIMEQAMQRFCPDVPVKTEPTIMSRWWKEAEPVWAADGVLDLWEPKA